jgi:hypothetical protein
MAQTLPRDRDGAAVDGVGGGRDARERTVDEDLSGVGLHDPPEHLDEGALAAPFSPRMTCTSDWRRSKSTPANATTPG